MYLATIGYLNLMSIPVVQMNLQCGHNTLHV